LTDRLNNIKALARIVAANQTWRSFRRVLIAMNATKEEIEIARVIYNKYDRRKVDEELYFCLKCGHRHHSNSDIGKKHLNYKI